MPRPLITLEENEPIGLLAGSGRFPIVFAEAARRQGHFVYGVGVINMADEALPDACSDYDRVLVGRIGRAIRLFRKAGVKKIVMAGKIDKTVLLRPYLFWRLLPDWRTLHMWFRYATRDKKDDTLLLAVIREFERDGMTFLSALDFAPELLVEHGFLTRRKPTPAQWKDIHFGWELAKKMGELDIGQSVMVKDTAVLAVEAVEGTDRCIQRAGELCRKGGFTVVKVAKPQQDMRFDVPTIGLQTIITMHEAGARVLAIESDMTILLDKEEVLQLADKFGIAMVALSSQEQQIRLSA